MNKLLLIAFSLLPLTFVQCGLFKPRHCNPEAAQQMGYEDALSGSVGRARMSQGQSCQKEYSPSSFEKDYMSGFMRGREELCQDSRAGELAVKDANEGVEQKNLNVFAVCTEGKFLKDALEKRYKKVFAEEFCKAERAQKLGESQASAYQNKDFSIFEKTCSTKSPKKLKELFEATYHQKLQEKCSPVELQVQGMQDARAGKDMSQTLSQLKICPSSAQSDALAAYSRGFNDTKALMLREQELKEAREAQERERALRVRELKLRESEMAEQRAARGGGVVFSVNGQDLLAQCEIRGSTAHVLIKNLGDRYVPLNGDFEVDVFDYRGEFLTREKQRVYKSVSARGSESFQFSVLALGRPTSCSPKFVGR